MKLKIFYIFFEILLRNSKPVIVGTIYCLPSQNNFPELLNSNINKINSVDNKIYILRDFHQLVFKRLLHFGKEYLKRQVNSK